MTGLVVVDTAGHWSTFGELVILGLIQVGGLGIMTLASLLGMLVVRRLGLRMRRNAQTETKSLGLGDIRSVIAGVIALSLTIELVISCALTARFVHGYGQPLGTPPTSGSSTPSPRSTTPGSPCTRTASSATPPTRWSACRCCSR